MQTHKLGHHQRWPPSVLSMCALVEHARGRVVCALILTSFEPAQQCVRVMTVLAMTCHLPFATLLLPQVQP